MHAFFGVTFRFAMICASARPNENNLAMPCQDTAGGEITRPSLALISVAKTWGCQSLSDDSRPSERERPRNRHFGSPLEEALHFCAFEISPSAEPPIISSEAELIQSKALHCIVSFVTLAQVSRSA